MRLGFNDIPSENMIRPNQRIVVENMVHLHGCRLKLYCLQKSKKRETAQKWSSTVFEWTRMSSSNHRMFGQRSFGSKVAKVDCRYITAFVVPCTTRVGVYIPSGVIND